MMEYNVTQIKTIENWFYGRGVKEIGRFRIGERSWSGSGCEKYFQRSQKIGCLRMKRDMDVVYYYLVC